MTCMQDRTQLRQSIRQARLQLSPEQRLQAATQMTQHLIHHPIVAQSQHIAVYMASQGEMETQLLLQHFFATGKNCYLPVIHPEDKRRLWFVPYAQDDPLVSNRFNILEPSTHRHEPLPPWALDLVLVPLLAFDLHGMRLGMGGGFYDHTFAFMRDKDLDTPRLIGLAYELQKTKRLEKAQWDIPLSGVATEKQLYVFTPANTQET